MSFQCAVPSFRVYYDQNYRRNRCELFILMRGADEKTYRVRFEPVLHDVGTEADPTLVDDEADAFINAMATFMRASGQMDTATDAALQSTRTHLKYSEGVTDRLLNLLDKGLQQ